MSSTVHCVIGSGPAGVACARALVARGARVLMLDAGLELEADRAQIVRELAATSPAAWPPEKVSALTGDLQAKASGVPTKLIFGSDFPYRDAGGHLPWHGPDTEIRPSLALGGLSNAWGAAMLPHRDADIAGWPITNADLAPHFRAVTQITGLAAETDALAELFPLHCDRPQPLPASRQVQRFLNHLGRHRTRLNQRGWHFGRSRLAVRAADNERGQGCVCCGLCLSGCPYDCIYNSAGTVRQLRAEKNFTYQGDVIVTRLREDSTGVHLEARHRVTGAPLTFAAGRVYLAAGVIPTAQLVLRSQAAYDQTLTLRDSQYFLLPLLMARGTRGVAAEALYTLSQAFLEIADPGISRRSIHLQIYGYSDWVGQAIRHSLGPLKFLARPLVERMLIVQGFLHSDESPVIRMTLRRTGRGEGDCLYLVPQPQPEARLTVSRLQRALLRQARQLGGLVLPPMLQMAKPGRSFHSGGSLPMRAKPAALESDVLGRPHGWSRIHAVDASVLPSIPATTVTFSVMANAHRIGWETAEV